MSTMRIITSSQFLFLSSLLASFFFISFAFGATSCLPNQEVQALKDIAKALGKKGWENPCSNVSNLNLWTSQGLNFTCNRSVLNHTSCHVVAIMLPRQNLQGKLPPEIANLPHLEQIDLSRNYLNGTIPTEWGAAPKLRILHIIGNRLSGKIPIELANIATLEELLIEFNNFSGSLPPQLGALPNLTRLHVTSNSFTGELPETLSRLTSLKELRLGDNQFSGKIPNFIQRWTNLENLVIQGSGFSGPIPSGISSLRNLTELIITDLNGPDSKFPPISNMTKLITLVLRSCNIKDTIPLNLGRITTNLKILDLSYNKLIGGIPEFFNEELQGVTIYLTGNLLSGQLPQWTNNFNSIDLSYNNFSNDSPSITCQQNRNLFASFSNGNNSFFVCERNKDTCPKTFYGFHINCGGRSVTIGNTTYDGDSDEGPSKMGAENWAFSNTGGDFLHNDNGYQLIPKNETMLLNMPSHAETELYMYARASSISLTYYAFCLANGNYTVKLHFAEIIFTNNDNTFSSLGRRLFDVYIQGKRVMKDFNIAKEAKGSDFPPPSSNQISSRVLAGILALAVIIAIIMVLCVLWWRGCLGRKIPLAQELRNLNQQTGMFTLNQIKVATNNFNISNKIGEGGFGPVYKGTLSDGTMIAVKQLSPKSNQGNREFINEIAMISALQHPCLVKLYGCCVAGDDLFLVYEYLENNSLALALFGPKERHLKLNWERRHKICVGIARGLAFLHEESRLKIVHRDIKATNVLLDKDLNPKISDFGLARLRDEDATHISTRIAGTYGYMAPEYAMHGYLTDKADVYSFGIVVLELISGKNNTIHRSKGEQVLYLLDWAHLLKEKGMHMELVDRRLGSDFSEEEAMVMIQVALVCTNTTPSLRPCMSSVVSVLEGRAKVPEFVSDSSEVMDEMKLEAMRQYYYHKEQDNKIMKNETKYSLNDANDGKSTASTSSDLYPLRHDSSSFDW